MAIAAGARGDGVIAGQREARAVVVEGRIQPGRRAVAGIAGPREICRDVIRIRGALEIFQVAGHARRAVQRVVVVRVAVCALPRRHGVQSSQRESRGGVIKLAISPLHRVVTLLAGCGKTSMWHRRRCAVVGGLMAVDAGCAGDAVVVVDVTVAALARRNRVCSSQSKVHHGMVEGRGRPGGRGMALVTGRWKIRHHVVGIGRLLEIRQMAAYTRRTGQVVVIVGVTVRALTGRHGVRIG